MTEIKNRISIQVGLSGYSFRIYADGVVRTSEWMSAENVFATPEFQKQYDEVEISVFTPKCALVPAQFYRPEAGSALLSEVVEMEDGEEVETVSLPQFSAVMLYSARSGGALGRVIAETVRTTGGLKVKPRPELYYMLSKVHSLHEYNRILASYMDGYVYLVIAQGKTLLLCNSYKAPDFTTAEYFIFLALKKLQLNHEISTICFCTPLEQEQEMSLYRYFKTIERI